MKRLATLLLAILALSATAVETGVNLLPNGDFEHGNPFTGYTAADTPRLATVPAPAFLCGATSLRLDQLAHTDLSIRTAKPLPIIPGKTAHVSLWMKASQDNLLAHVIIDFFQSGQNRHLYRTFRFRVGTEWNLYSFDYDIPADTEAYTALKAGTCILRLGIPKTPEPNVAYLDDVEFTLLP
ncbi:MAG: hypothetical protein ACI4WT_00920 [Oligosphaeraceae bacterium]